MKRAVCAAHSSDFWSLFKSAARCLQCSIPAHSSRSHPDLTSCCIARGVTPEDQRDSQGRRPPRCLIGNGTHWAPTGPVCASAAPCCSRWGSGEHEARHFADWDALSKLSMACSKARSSSCSCELICQSTVHVGPARQSDVSPGRRLRATLTLDVAAQNSIRYSALYPLHALRVGQAKAITAGAHNTYQSHTMALGDTSLYCTE